ncbi:hypothetical protein GALMADRAFT_250611 [Galerina marginata CBS 339.88]|uniref:Histone chaperone RTT106/FACT complex subunit SPT16-like middle domain-containing protein n=1 Tax=Galerina marginata (strain CBS 339.88) TaxID=685588 RepID=A0A067T1X3_GALM3|nr:hypothetical protein GALMADRAFT_250611 [Galerina marginata CBS 339.88]
MPTLPTEVAGKLRSLCTSSTNESVLENLVRLLVGADVAPDASKSVQEQWSEKQTAARAVITGLLPPPAPEKKRSREDELDDDSQQPKKPRLGAPNGAATPTPVHTGPPIFSLHAISTTSPVRKKVDITIHSDAIALTHPASGAVEGTVPLTALRRAFIVPTRGKSKPHWTVILLSSDIPDKSKPGAGTSSENQQVIFGVDATTSTAFTTTIYTPTSEPSATTHPKGTPTLPFLRQFLSKLNTPLIEPSVAVFKSACPGIGSNANRDGVPGVEGYRAAKPGSLWFAAEGILWGESKPCEFWAVGDLLGKTEGEGLRVVGAGRTCSVVLTRRSSAIDGDEEDGEGEDVGEETEFGMVDSKEREGIYEWVRNHRHLFGRNGASGSGSGSAAKGKGKETEEEEEGGSSPAPKTKTKTKPKPQYSGPLTIRTLQEGSDSEDEDFAASDSDLDGSERMSSDSSSDEDGDEAGGGGDGGRENEVGSEEDGEGDDDDEEAAAEDEEGELDPARHPLLRPGAMPRMSKAALEMAVGIVEDAFMGGRDEPEEEGEDEMDELDD